MATSTSTAPALQLLDKSIGHGFAVPSKRIHDGDDVSSFLASKAYADIMTFLFQLNTAMLPRRTSLPHGSAGAVKQWKLNDANVSHLPVVKNLAKLLDALSAVIDQAPPDPGPRRFGNASFRSWFNIVREQIPALLDQYLPSEVLAYKSTSDVPAKSELEAYLMGSFGSAQRLDYGTGHELSFLAFLGCLWKLGAFTESNDGEQERGIVMGVIEPYLVLIRRLIITYTLEPAGSHGVWGLDDHSFLPYIFGSAQFSPAITTPADVVTEGSLPGAPNPADVAKAPAVERERASSMYFSAIGFIYDVKKGPFWEHSPILFDISGVKAGWAKINKGMIKMYNAEVLSKFPVVQHFPFGSLFSFEQDPNAKAIQASVHTASQPKATVASSMAPMTARTQPALRDPLIDLPATTARTSGGTPGTSAPWTTTQTSRAPQASSTAAATGTNDPNIPTKAPWASNTPASLQPVSSTAAPWAKSQGQGAHSVTPDRHLDIEPTTRAPWAK